MTIRDIRFSQSALLTVLKDILGAASPAKSTSTTSDDGGTAQLSVSDDEILERWNSILLEIKRTHLHLYLLTGFDGIEEDVGLVIKPRRSRIVEKPFEDDDLADLLHVRDEQSTGTAGAAASATTWNVRVLNTVVGVNEIIGSSLGSNQVTLTAGTYELVAFAPAYFVKQHKLRWYNTTDTATELVGSAEFAQNGSESSQTMSRIFGRFTISAEKVFELQHWTELGGVAGRLGQATTQDEVEVYSEVWIKKLT